MGLAKLTSGHIAGMGAGIALVIAIAWYLLGPYKTNQNIKALDTRDSDAQTKIAQEPKNRKDKAKAEQEVKEVQAQFAVYDRNLMPQPSIDLTKPADETAMTKAMIRLWRQPYELCTAANKFARDQAKKYHVQLQSPPFTISGQTTDPQAIPTIVITFPLGPLQVAGSFHNVCDFMRSWDHFKRVVAIDAYTLATGPNPAGGDTVVGQATATCYIYPKANPGQTSAGNPAEGSTGGAPPGYSGPPGFGGPPGSPKGGA